MVEFELEAKNADRLSAMGAIVTDMVNGFLKQYQLYKALQGWGSKVGISKNNAENLELLISTHLFDSNKRYHKYRIFVSDFHRRFSISPSKAQAKYVAQIV